MTLKNKTLFPKNVTADYFKDRIEDYNQYVLPQAALTKMVSLCNNNFCFTSFDTYRLRCIYDYPTFHSYYPTLGSNCIVRSPIVTKYDQPFPAFDDRLLGGSVCINCGEIFKINPKMDKKGQRIKCLITDGDGIILKEYKEHKTMSIPDKERTNFDETPTKDNSKVKHTIVAIHCDIVYTTAGIAVASCYLVDPKFNLILAETVKIDQRVVTSYHPLNNYLKTKNVNQHGITLEELKQKIFALVDKSTIIVGFDLAPILRTLKIVHRNIVDLAFHARFIEYKDSLFNYLKDLAQKTESISSHKNGSKQSSELMATAYITLICIIYMDNENGRDDSILLLLKDKESITDESSDSDFEEIEFDESCQIFDKYRKPLIINNYKDRRIVREAKKDPNNFELNFVLPPKISTQSIEETNEEGPKYIEIKKHIPVRGLWVAHDLTDLSEVEDEEAGYDESISGSSNNIYREKVYSKMYNLLKSKINTYDHDNIKCGFPVWSSIKVNNRLELANTFKRYRRKDFLGPNQTVVECAKCNKEYSIDDECNQTDLENVCVPVNEEGFEDLYSVHYMKTLPYKTRDTFEFVFNYRSNHQVLIVNSSIVYTTHGPEIAKLCVLNASKQEVFNILVKVENKVIEYDFENTNLTSEILSSATTDREWARSKLFNLMNDSTILVGFNLALTLRCLRICYDNVVELHWIKSNSPITKLYQVPAFDKLCNNVIAKENLLFDRSVATFDLIQRCLNDKKTVKKQKRSQVRVDTEYENELRDDIRIEKNAYKRFLWN
uniref:Exonuclease domain-containing protein n=1 Tax=Rhabditophanes sp. KR3021 TaxID=114890 RepID=A0AC35U005_9BILA